MVQSKGLFWIAGMILYVMPLWFFTGEQFLMWSLYGLVTLLVTRLLLRNWVRDVENRAEADSRVQELEKALEDSRLEVERLAGDVIPDPELFRQKDQRINELEKRVKELSYELQTLLKVSAANRL